MPSSYWLLVFFSSRRRHTRYIGDWSSDVCSSDLDTLGGYGGDHLPALGSGSFDGHQGHSPVRAFTGKAPALPEGIPDLLGKGFGGGDGRSLPHRSRKLEPSKRRAV